jgi:hypothetical protein
MPVNELQLQAALVAAVKMVGGFGYDAVEEVYAE